MKKKSVLSDFLIITYIIITSNHIGDNFVVQKCVALLRHSRNNIILNKLNRCIQTNGA